MESPRATPPPSPRKWVYNKKLSPTKPSPTKTMAPAKEDPQLSMSKPSKPTSPMPPQAPHQQTLKDVPGASDTSPEAVKKYMDEWDRLHAMDYEELCKLSDSKRSILRE